MLQEAGHIKNTVVLIFRHIQCLHLMNSEVAWVLVLLGTQVQPQIIVSPDYLPDYLSVFYEINCQKDRRKNEVYCFVEQIQKDNLRGR